MKTWSRLWAFTTVTLAWGSAAGLFMAAAGLWVNSGASDSSYVWATEQCDCECEVQ